MLLGNYQALNKSPGKNSLSLLRAQNNGSAQARGMFTHFDQKTSVPDGARPPICWVIANKDGGLSMRSYGEGTITGNLAGGKNAEAILTGSGDLTATMALIVSGVATLNGSGTLTAEIIGVGNIEADLSGSGSLTGDLKALAHCVATLTGSGSMSAVPYAIGNMEAEITPFETLSPSNLAAAVWNAVAATYNTAGSMGNKVNSAASAGDPWTTELPAAYAEGTAGAMVGFLYALAHNKVITDPATGEMKIYDEDGSTVLWTASLFEDAAGVTPYDGGGAERRDDFQ